MQCVHVLKQLSFITGFLFFSEQRFALHTLQYLLSDHPTFLPAETTDELGRSVVECVLHTLEMDDDDVIVIIICTIHVRCACRSRSCIGVDRGECEDVL